MKAIIESLSGRTLQIEEQTYLYCSGTSYLGIQAHPVFHRYLLEGISKYGSNYGGSRRSNLLFSVFEEAEAHLADLVGREAALTFSSGTLAAQALTQHLAQTHQLFYVPKTHPALFQSPSLANRVADTNWQATLVEQLKNASKPVAILCNAIDPLYVQKIDFSWLNTLPENQKTLLVIDDSHGLGIVGEKGQGSASLLVVPSSIELVVVASLAKAYAIPGGAIMASKERIKAIENTALFGGASPIVPAYLDAFLKSKNLYINQLQTLRARIQQLLNRLPKRSEIYYQPDYPVFRLLSDSLVKALEKNKVLISSFAYPTAESPLLHRLVLNALHEEEDVERLIEIMNKSESENDR